MANYLHEFVHLLYRGLQEFRVDRLKNRSESAARLGLGGAAASLVTPTDGLGRRICRPDRPWSR